MPASPHPAKRVLIIGLDRLAPKNLHQLNALNPEGYAFDIWVTDRSGASLENVKQADQPEANRCHALKATFLARLFQILPLFFKDKEIYHHVEIYPGGRFARVYLWLARMAGMKTLIMERGDLVDYEHYPRLIQKSMQACYRHGDWVCYREPYMLPLLKEYRADRMVFIHNAIQLPVQCNTGTEKKYDFLWTNRFVAQRYPDWVADILGTAEFSNATGAMLGLQDYPGLDQRVREKQDYVRKRKPENLELHMHADPKSFYLASRFFLLPADVVFCNFALIEAMAHGVVPIITESPGAELLVTDGVDGFISERNPEAYKKTMQRALGLTPAEYETLSRNTAKKIREQFSLEQWTEKMRNLYRDLEAAG